MPNNWKTYKLSDALEIKYGKDHKKVQDGNIPIYGTGGIMRYGNQALYDKETILIPRKGSLNNIYYLNEPFWSVDTIFWSKINEEVAFPKYLFYNLKVLDFASMDVGSAIPSLTTELLKKIEIDLPSLSEQKSIAQILSTIDDKIENNLAINKTLEEMAMALYKHWFVDFGPFQNGEFVDSELGSIPKGWEVKRLGDLYDTTSGGTPSRKKMEYYDNGTIQWIKSKELDNTFIIDTEEKITEVALAKSSAKRFPARSVLIAMYGATVGEIAINSEISTCNQAICAIKEVVLPYFYVYLFLKKEKENILNQAVGSAQQNISQIIIKNLRLIDPKLEDIKDLFIEFDSIFNKLESNIKENQTLTQLRDTLLPKLISGEIRLKEFREAITN
jgi:type I restriction enzyme S subunit